MRKKLHLVGVLCVALGSCASNETVEPGQALADTACTWPINARNVLVLDVEHLRTQPEKAQEFADEHAGDFRLASTLPQEVITRSRRAKDPDEFNRRLSKVGAEQGCDLVLVLKTGPYFGRQRSAQPRRIKSQGYALVVMGERLN